MVNRGASYGCATCKRRRVKCDESKPQCKECLRLGHECAYYQSKTLRVRFRDETARYSRKSPGQEPWSSDDNQSPTSMTAIVVAEPRSTWIHPKRKKKTSNERQLEQTTSPYTPVYDYAILPSPPPYQQDLAVTFFLSYVTVVGRSLESTRGFLEFVSPALATERHDSALSSAVNALSTLIWARLRHRSVSTSLQIQIFRRALLQLQKAIVAPEEKSRDATVLAALLLQSHDTLSAVFGQQRALSTHRDGAWALLLERGDQVGSSKYYASLLGNFLHAKVSLSIREGVHLPLRELEWLKTKVIPIVPINPSSLLDRIGLDVVSLQHSACKSSSLGESRLADQFRELSKSVRTVESQLQDWLEVIPQYWYPKRVRRERDIDSSIEAFEGACDIYPSIQIASIWNTWRIYCLIVKNIKLQLSSDFLNLDHNLDHNLDYAQSKVEYLDVIEDITRHSRQVQDLIDSICYSIPFYLGNCTEPVCLTDMEHPRRMFPSYHDLNPSDEAFLLYQAGDHYVSKADHACHVILQGPIHMLSILSTLIGLITGDRGLMIAQTLRDEQRLWISGQFLRVLHLFRLSPTKPSFEAGYSDDMEVSEQPSTKMLEAQRLADSLRQGIWTMTIL